MIWERQKIAHIRCFFGQSRVIIQHVADFFVIWTFSHDFSIGRISNFYWSTKQLTSLYGTSLVLWSKCTKIVILIFQMPVGFPDFLFRKCLNNLRAAVMLQVIPSFCASHSKIRPHLSASTHEKYIVSKDYCFAHHDNKMCILPIYRFHIILLGDIEELLQKLDAFCFTYQHVDCLDTIFRYRISKETIKRSEQVSNNDQRAVYYNQRPKTVDSMPSTAEGRILKKKC